jgi:hypothetical protein
MALYFFSKVINTFDIFKLYEILSTAQNSRYYFTKNEQRGELVTAHRKRDTET